MAIPKSSLSAQVERAIFYQPATSFTHFLVAIKTRVHRRPELLGSVFLEGKGRAQGWRGLVGSWRETDFGLKPSRED